MEKMYSFSKMLVFNTPKLAELDSCIVTFTAIARYLQFERHFMTKDKLLVVQSEHCYVVQSDLDLSSLNTFWRT